MSFVVKSTKGCTIKHLPILGHGNQGTVFDKGNYVTKVFSLGSSRPNDSDGKVASRISTLELKSFVKPYNLTFNNGKLMSFDMERLFLDKEKKVVSMQIEDVISSLSDIRSDVEVLSNNGIMINDFQTHNIGISNNRIRVFDFSDYSFSDTPSLPSLNNSEIDSVFGSILLMQEISDVDSISIYDSIYSDYLRSGASTIEEYFKVNVLGHYDNLDSFVRDKVKIKSYKRS